MTPEDNSDDPTLMPARPSPPGPSGPPDHTVDTVTPHATGQGSGHAADASTGSNVNALPPGTRLEEFELHSVLGEGGFGIVYVAWDPRLDREVALKVVSEHLADDEAFTPEPDAAAKNLGEDARPVIEASIAALDALTTWTTPEIETALKGALVDGLGLKPRKAFGPVRVAVTGRTVSPPLYESLELLGRERTLSRLRKAIA